MYQIIIVKRRSSQRFDTKRLKIKTYFFIPKLGKHTVMVNFGQTSGHSFAHSTIPRSAGGFMGIDLGDNYPRAIYHWIFDQNSIEFKKVYSFKTEHSNQAKSPAEVTYPAYP